MNISPPSPPTSEGPYKVEADTTLLTKEPIYMLYCGKTWIENFDIRGHADTWCNRLNTAHARATAEQAKNGEELVRAASRFLEAHDSGVYGAAGANIKALRTALKGMETKPTPNHGANPAPNSPDSLTTPD